MAEHGNAIRRLSTGALLLLIGVLILQALGYGIGFFLDPESGVGEFASPPPTTLDDLTIALVGLVGVAMIGTAVMLTTAALLIARGRRAGPVVSFVVGAVYVLAGVSAFRADWAWDGGFYATAGALLSLLSLTVFLIRDESSSGQVAVGSPEG